MKRATAENTSNIKRMNLYGHPESSKFINDDWGTMAFFIPRNTLASKFADTELQYNCIYFLIGNDGIKWNGYVGQAKKRNNGGSVLLRLREHDKSETETYNNAWNYVIVVTNKNDTWNLDDLNALENLLYREIASEKNLNGNIPNSAGANFERYTDKVKQIKSYIAMIGIDIFEQPEDIEDVSITQVVNECTPVEDLQNGLARIPEIVTPQKVVKGMIDSLPEEVWNSKTTFLDLACKGGEYLKEIFNRLMETESLQAEFPNEISRAFHILDKQLFGIALSPISLNRTTNLLNGYGKNIKVIPGYIDILKTKNTVNLFADRLKEEFGQMKFDVVIGNPPYQEGNGSGNGGGGSALYDKFVLKALEISDRYVSLITPAKWYADEKKVIELKQKLLTDGHIKELHDFPNAEDVFKGVYIMGGVCYYLIDRQYTGDCKVVTHMGKHISISNRKIKEDFSDIFIRDSMGVSILQKVIVDGFISFYQYINDYNVFKIRSYERGSVIESGCNNIKLYYTGNNSKGGGIGYIALDDIPARKDLLNGHKVFINSVSDNMLRFPYKVLYKAFYGEPNSVCTESYLVIGCLKKKEYAENIIKYLATKFVRVLVHQRKTSQLAYKKVYKFVPVQDFTSESDIDWTNSISEIDRQLYQKYNLTQDEIDYIESTIKPMD